MMNMVTENIVSNVVNKVLEYTAPLDGVPGARKTIRAVLVNTLEDAFAWIGDGGEAFIAPSAKGGTLVMWWATDGTLRGECQYLKNKEEEVSFPGLTDEAKQWVTKNLVAA